MATKPIIKIDIDDSAFQRFASMFKAYSDKLEEQPAEWRELNEAMTQAGGSFSKSTMAAQDNLAIAAASTAAMVEGLKEATKAQTGLQAATLKSDVSMGRLFKSSTGVAKNFVGLTSTIAKYAGMAELFGGAGALLGLDRLAGTVTQTAETSGGVGLSPGRYAAFTTGLSSVIPDGGAALLQGVASAQTDSTQWYKFAQMGLDFNKEQLQTSAQTAIDVLKQAVGTYKADPNFALPQLQAALGFGLTQSDIKFAASEPSDQLNQQLAAALNPSIAASLGWNQKTTENYQALNQALAQAKSQIEAALVNGLAPLIPDFKSLVSATIALTPQFVSLMNGIEPLAKMLGYKIPAPTFSLIKDARHDLSWFYHNTMKAIDGFLDGTVVGNARDQAIAASSAQTLSSIESAKKLPPGLLNALAKVESNWNPAAISPKGADGVFQLMPSVAASMRVDPFDPLQAAAAAGTIMASNLKKYGDLKEAIAAYNWGDGNLDADLKVHGKDWLKFSPKETQKEVSDVLYDMEQHPARQFRKSFHAQDGAGVSKPDRSEYHLQTIASLMRTLVAQGLVKPNHVTAGEPVARTIPMKAQMAAGGVRN